MSLPQDGEKVEREEYSGYGKMERNISVQKLIRTIHLPACLLSAGNVILESIRILDLVLRRLWNLGSNLKSKKPNFRWAFCFVELEGFEPSSKHGTVYAFYMFSCSLIVGRGKVSRLPIPDAVVAVSHKCLATSHLPVLLFDAPNVKPKNRI